MTFTVFFTVLSRYILLLLVNINILEVKRKLVLSCKYFFPKLFQCIVVVIVVMSNQKTFQNLDSYFTRICWHLGI